MKGIGPHIGKVAAALAFVGTLAFFQLAYPYHLVRREQLDLFLFDGDYILETYRGAGFLSRFAGDFLEQFFHLPVAGWPSPPWTGWGASAGAPPVSRTLTGSTTCRR